MWMPLLLLLFALSPSISGEAAAPSDGHFDTDRCAAPAADMACFVPGSCTPSGSATELEMSKTKDVIDNCPVLLAIRAHSSSYKKWLVVMRGKGLDTNELRFSKNDDMLFECKITGDEPTLLPGLGVKQERFISKVFDKTENYYHCEFEVSFATPVKSTNDDPMKLTYSFSGAPQAPGLAETSLVGDLLRKMRCNPDDIQFENASSPSESHSEVDAHRMAVRCLDGWKLTKKEDTGYSPVVSLICEEDKTETNSKKKFKYKVTTATEPDGKWIAKDEKFFARCAQNPCIACKEVVCATDGCKLPKFAPGSGDTCASLTCEKDRFEVPVQGTELLKQIQSKASCVGGQWTIPGAAPFTKANCFTEFATCNPTRSQCTDPNEKMTIDRSTGRTTVAKLECDKQTGKWMADGKEVEAAANVTCSPITTTTTAATVSAVTEATSGLMLALGCSGGFLVLAIVCWRIRRNSKRVSSSGGGNTETPSNDTSKARKGERSSKSQTGAPSSSHSQQMSGGDHKTEKSLATAIPAEPLNSPREELEEHTPPREQPPRPATKPYSAPPSRPTPPPPPSTQPATSGSTPGTGPTTDDGVVGIKKLVDGPDGYVLVDPLEIAAEEKRREELKRKEAAAAAAAATREKTGGTQHVGVLPPPGASAAPVPLAPGEEKPLSRLTPPVAQPHTATAPAAPSQRAHENPALAAATQ